ncbi:MAG: hypothetical protein Q4G25_03780 [Paracoccus sp. (in: a-proteobacteria)]|nr:hypothetical protein [Paracoccus sp. (in: a-proteobacteria)]
MDDAASGAPAAPSDAAADPDAGPRASSAGGPAPLREIAAEPYFKSWDDAAARLVRSVFLLGAGGLGLLFLPVVFGPVVGVLAAPASFGGLYQFIVTLFAALIFMAGVIGSLIWGAVVLLGAINAAIIAASQDMPEAAGRISSGLLRLFSRERRFVAMVLPAMSLSVILVVVLISGISASKDLIRDVFRATGVLSP